MRVEIWSDIVCPWCYVGKRRFERALDAFLRSLPDGPADAPGARDRVEVIWRAFELEAQAERDPGTTVVDVLAAKYGGGRERAEGMIAHVTAEAAREGLAYRLDVARRGNSFDAHRVARLAHDHGLQDAFVERAMRAYFSEGAAIGDPSTLARLARDAGLDVGATASLLASDTHADAVRADERLAEQLGLNGVPSFVFDRTTLCSGAQSTEVLLAYLHDAWARRTVHADIVAR